MLSRSKYTSLHNYCMGYGKYSRFAVSVGKSVNAPFQFSMFYNKLYFIEFGDVNQNKAILILNNEYQRCIVMLTHYFI